MAVGLDVGTMNCVSARQGDDKTVHFNRVRDAFLDVDPDAKNMLKLRQTSFLEVNDRCIIIGDEAINVASIFNRDARRPMEKGVLSRDEDAQLVLTEILRTALGPPHEENEVCYYSIPAEALDQDNKVTYHKKILAKILKSLGYHPVAKNEAYAICMSECANDGFSGLTLSWGAGMVNVCLTYATLPSKELQFSLAQSGDWIDHYSAQSIGSITSRVVQVKEKGLNLLNPQEGDPREQKIRESVCFHYEQAIEDVLMQVTERFNTFKDRINLPEPVPLVVSGGTSKADGFLELLKEVLGNLEEFPIPVSDIRMAADPLTSVANGLLVCALNHGQ